MGNIRVYRTVIVQNSNKQYIINKQHYFLIYIILGHGPLIAVHKFDNGLLKSSG